MRLGVGIAASVPCFSWYGPTGTISLSAGAIKQWTALQCSESITALNNGPLSNPERVRFVELSAKTLRALADGDLTGASAEAGVALHEHLTSDRARWIVAYRPTNSPRTRLSLPGSRTPRCPSRTGPSSATPGSRGHRTRPAWSRSATPWYPGTTARAMPAPC